jgi:4-amino-4-deoxy-L-arabinose transferase-like glycosyltransferase
MIILPFTALLALFVVLRRARGLEWKQAVVYTQVIFFLFIAVSTEALSALNILRRPALVATWGVVVLVLFSLLALLRFRKTAVVEPPAMRIRLSLFEWLTIIFVCGILGVTLLIALCAPPNNVDSMTYHMTKVAHWIQQGNVRFFATSNARQNYLAPLSEYAVLHFQLLAGSDRFANVVQWMSFASCIITVGLLIEQFGGARRTQFFGAMLAATIPMAILQSTSTQTDLVASLFVLAFVYFVRRLQKEQSWENAIMCGAALGLGILTKGTFYFFCAPIAGLYGLLAILKANNWVERRRVTVAFGFVVILGLALNGPIWQRTHQVFGAVFPHKIVKNEKPSVRALWTIGLRNIGSNFNTPSRYVRWYTYRAIRWLGGKNLDDPATTFQSMPFTVSSDAYSEDSAGNVIHLALIFFAAAILLWRVRPGGAELRYYAGAVFAGAVLFSLMLKWQPWGTRLQLPLFMMAVPFTAIILAEGLGPRWPAMKYIVWTAVLTWCIPYVFENQSRPIIPRAGYKTILKTSRAEAYFAGSPDLYNDYTNAVAIVMNARAEKVGLYTSHNDPEYPLWALADKAAVPQQPYLMHVGVNDASARLDSNSPPEFIIATQEVRTHTFNGAPYKVIFQGPRHEAVVTNVIQVLQRESVTSAR